MSNTDPWAIEQSDFFAWTTKLDTFLNFISKKKAGGDVWPISMANSCCGSELYSTSSEKYFGNKISAQFLEDSPEDCNLLIIGGVITSKMALEIKQVYSQMLTLKKVMALGNCSCGGGLYPTYNIVKGIEKIIPIDIYIPGCPPSPEVILAGVLQLLEEVSVTTGGPQ